MHAVTSVTWLTLLTSTYQVVLLDGLKKDLHPGGDACSYWCDIANSSNQYIPGGLVGRVEEAPAPRGNWMQLLV